MGMLRLLGQKGYTANLSEAINYLSQSAARADLDAPQGPYVFGLLLADEFRGVSVPESILPHNFLEAHKMLEKACSLRFSHAMRILRNAYENATFECNYDSQLSLYYYMLAVKQGMIKAMRELMIDDIDAMTKLSK